MTPNSRPAIRLVLHAPGVHVGGGLVLLREFLSAASTWIRVAQIDCRFPYNDLLPTTATVHRIRNSLFARLNAEWRLRKLCTANDIVLCFHGVPPVLPLPSRVVVFVQNRLLVDSTSLAEFPTRVKLRIGLERFLSNRLQAYCSRYIVQTPSMAAAMHAWLRHPVPVSIAPFAPICDSRDVPSESGNSKEFDFVYVASGDAHKNHLNLLEAWKLLAAAHLRPSLALTVDPSVHPGLSEEIARLTRDYHLRLSNLGHLNPHDVTTVYRRSKALIYPSMTESLGLPLIEGRRQGLDIIASERDFVRDVVAPCQTFDPASPVSICRAVRRYLGVEEAAIDILSVHDFLAEVVR